MNCIKEVHKCHIYNINFNPLKKKVELYITATISIFSYGKSLQLGHLVAATIGQFLGFFVGSTPSTSMMVSHLLFADDTLIFCDVEPNQLITLREILTRFE